MRALPAQSLPALLLGLVLAAGAGVGVAETAGSGADQAGVPAALPAEERAEGSVAETAPTAAPAAATDAAPPEPASAEPPAPSAPAISDTVGALAAYASALGLHLEQNPVLAATYIAFFSELDAAERAAGGIEAVPAERYATLAATGGRVAAALRQRYADGPAPYRLADTLTVALGTLAQTRRADAAGTAPPEALLQALDRVVTPRVSVNGRYEFAGSLAGAADLGFAPDLWLRCRQSPACVATHDALFAEAMGGVSLGASLGSRLEKDPTLRDWDGRAALEAGISLLESRLGPPSNVEKTPALGIAGSYWQALGEQLRSPGSATASELPVLLTLGRTTAYLAGEERLAASFGVVGPPLLNWYKAASKKEPAAGSLLGAGLVGASYVGATAGLGLLFAGVQALALFDGMPGPAATAPPPELDRLVAALHETTYRNFVGLRAETLLSANAIDTRLAGLGVALDVVKDDVARIETAQRTRLRADFQAQDARRWTAFDEDNDRCFSLRQRDAAGRLRPAEFRRCEERFLQGAVRRAQYATRPTDFLLDARYLEAADLRFPFHHHYPLLLTTGGLDTRTALALADPFEWQQHAAALLRLYQENPAAPADYARRAEVLRALRAAGARTDESLAGLVRSGDGRFRGELHRQVLADYFAALEALLARVRALDDPDADRYGKRLTAGLDQPAPGGRKGAALEALLSGATTGNRSLGACANAPDEAFLTPESGLAAESRRLFDSPVTVTELARSWNRDTVGDFGLEPADWTALVPPPFLWAAAQGLGQLDVCLTDFRAEQAAFTRDEAPLRGHLRANARLVAGLDVRFSPGPAVSAALGLDPAAGPVPVAAYLAERRCTFTYRNDREGCSRGQCLADLAPLMWSGDENADINGGRCEGPPLTRRLPARNVLEGAGELVDFAAALEPLYWQARQADSARLEADALRSSEYATAAGRYLLYYALAGVTLGTYPAGEEALGPLYAADGGLAPRDVVQALVWERTEPAALAARLAAARADVKARVADRGRELEQPDAPGRLPHLRGLGETLARIDLLLAAYL